MASPSPTAIAKTIRAAQYIRMSTEHQRYSAANQRDRIARYAKVHGIEVVRTYADLGRSGLTLEGREGLANLLSDVVSGRADYNLILVYDVSRWGRFQDVDESAYYEFVCRRCNVRVEYCAELFRNDGTISSTLLKTIKRTMAGEYSRELSDKTFAGQCRLTRLGFKAGGSPGYGLRRLLIDENRKPKQILLRGQYKSLQSDRVLLVPGTRDELAVVREIFERCAKKGQLPAEIAKALNKRGVPGQFDKPWTHNAVYDILVNPKYTGVLVYHRTTQRLHTKWRRNPPEKWVRGPAAFEPIVTEKQFSKAAEMLVTRKRKYVTRATLLDAARRLLERHGKLSGKLIERADGVPSVGSYSNHIGGLIPLYRLIGYDLPQNVKWNERKHDINKIRCEHVEWIAAQLRANGATVQHKLLGSRFLVNDELSVSFRLATFHKSKILGQYWQIGLQRRRPADLTIIARLTPDNRVMDYFLFPRSEQLPIILRLRRENGPLWDSYRFENLDHFFQLARRQSIWEAKWKPQVKKLTTSLAPLLALPAPKKQPGASIPANVRLLSTALQSNSGSKLRL